MHTQNPWDIEIDISDVPRLAPSPDPRMCAIQGFGLDGVPLDDRDWELAFWDIHPTADEKKLYEEYRKNPINISSTSELEPDPAWTDNNVE